jgi:hypothetical protein
MAGANGKGKAIHTPLGVEAVEEDGIYLLEEPGNLWNNVKSPLRLLRVEYDEDDVLVRRHGIHGWELRIRRCTPVEEIPWPVRIDDHRERREQAGRAQGQKIAQLRANAIQAGQRKRPPDDTTDPLDRLVLAMLAG